MRWLGAMLLITGALLAAGGLALLLGDKLGGLPGDIVVRRERFSLFFPLTTCILLSLLLTILLNLLLRR